MPGKIAGLRETPTNKWLTQMFISNGARLTLVAELDALFLPQFFTLPALRLFPAPGLSALRS